MNMFALGVVTGFCLSWVSLAMGWFAHRELVHKPAMNRINRTAKEALEGK